MNIIKTSNLYKYYGAGETTVKAVDGVSFEIERGEFTAIIGPSGSGKTTLLHLIGGLDTPDQGEIKLSDQKIAAMKGNQLSDFRRDHIGFIFQAYNLIPVLTASENIEYIMLLQGIEKKERKKMDIIQMDPEEGAAALVSGDVVMACLFGGNSIKAATAVEIGRASCRERV